MRTTQDRTTDAPRDGRSARRHRNRAAVLDAVAQLFDEGNLTPGVNEVAERSGVSLRSVYRYFADVDDLVAAAIDREMRAAADLFSLPAAGEGPTPARIHRFCERRVALFERLRAVHRAALIRSTDQKAVSGGLERNRDELTRHIGVMFAPELQDLPPGDAEVVAGMLDALSQFETLEHLYTDRGHDTESATEFLVAAFSRVLAEPGRP